MPGSDPAAQFLDVPGARLYYERQGDGPLLLLIGSPMDSTGFAGLAQALASRYTVVTYDPRGIGHSTREDTTQDITPEQQADDVHRLLSALDGGPAGVFGSSGGAVVGLALVTAHPADVRTLVAHEPPRGRPAPRPRPGPRPDPGHLRHLPRRRPRPCHAQVHGPRRPGRPTRPGARRARLATHPRAGGHHAGRHRGVPRPPAPPHHQLPPRHRGP